MQEKNNLELFKIGLVFAIIYFFIQLVLLPVTSAVESESVLMFFAGFLSNFTNIFFLMTIAIVILGAILYKKPNKIIKYLILAFVTAIIIYLGATAIINLLYFINSKSVTYILTFILYAILVTAFFIFFPYFKALKSVICEVIGKDKTVLDTDTNDKNEKENDSNDTDEE